jgi:hypothetical protein
VDVAKRFRWVRNECSLISFNVDRDSFLGDHVLELGAETLDGEPSNNPLYRLADDYQLAEMDDSKYIETWSRNPVFDHSVSLGSIIRII